MFNNCNWFIIIDLYGGVNLVIIKVVSNVMVYVFCDFNNYFFFYEFYDCVNFGFYLLNGFEFLDGWVKSFIDGFVID